ncbi:MAG TPA: zf-HC2 domain-containing protein [Aggregatilineales bacterium]|nr:zf-HC2 domain-containing protein [Aggregatilineales bacterium]
MHVHHLIVAFAHGQLSRREQRRVLQHTQFCAECRVALDREIQFVADLRAELPAIGRPTARQMTRMWSALWTEYRGTNHRPSLDQPLQSIGMALALFLLCVFVSSAFFGGASQVIAAPLPPIPADVRATDTPVHTDTPGNTIPAALPSEVAIFSGIPKPSPVPVVGEMAIGN